MNNRIKASITQHLALLEQMMASSQYIASVEAAAVACIKAFQRQNKILFCGNGGSAADAQHLAAELSGRYLIDRAPLFAEALHVNTSYLTAVGNDYGFQDVYSRAIEAKGKAGDVLVALSTSGASENIVLALKKARSMDITTISFTSIRDQRLGKLSDVYLSIPSEETPRIQEMHILFGHIMCDLIEQQLFT